MATKYNHVVHQFRYFKRIYTRVAHALARKRPGVDIEPLLELVAIHTKLFPNSHLPKPVSRDPDDDKFIACAITAQAKFIVSGDQDLLEIGVYENIEIITPKAFVSRKKIN